MEESTGDQVAKAMRTNTILYPILSAVAVFSLAFFVSCASSGRVQQEEAFGSGESSSAEETVQGEEVASGEEATSDEGIAWEAGASEEPTTAAAGEAPAQTDDEFSFWEGEEGSKDQELVANAEPTPEKTGSEFEGLEESNAPTSEAVVEEGLGETAQAAPPEESVDDFALDETTQDYAAKETTPPAFEEPSAPSPTFDAGGFTSKPVVAPYKKSVTPIIPTEAKLVQGSSLNRFYFVRQGDNLESVSKLLYGSASRTNDLESWNGTFSQWKVGSVLYYSSPDQPEDGQMRSFYQEREVIPEAYTVQRGDWLSHIAEQKYGNALSWKEIAAINGLASPDTLKNGQHLALYPRDLSGYQHQVVVAKAPEKKEMAKAVPPKVEETFSPPVAEEPPPARVAPPSIPTPPVAKRPVAPPSFEEEEGIAKLLEQNMFFLAIGGVILLLFLSLIVVNKKRRARRDEFDDDAYSSRPKMKQK